MTRKILFIALLLFSFFKNLQAQEGDESFLIDSIKVGITQFFVAEGYLDKAEVRESRGFVYAIELQHKRSIGYDSIGIYRIGVHQSHSPENLLIKSKRGFSILKLENMGDILKELISFSEENHLKTEIMVEYVSQVIKLYELNHKNINPKTRKLRRVVCRA